MSLEQLDKVDFIVMPHAGVSDKIELIITDPGTITDPELRCKTLLKKLTYYFNIIISDSFKRKYPYNSLEEILIKVLSLTQPTEKMRKLNYVSYPGESNNPKRRVEIKYLMTEGKEWKKPFEKKTYIKG